MYSSAKRKSGPSRSAPPTIERMEDRILFAGWATVDDVTSASTCRIGGIASDATGNVFAVGTFTDNAGFEHGIVHEKAAGATTWAPLLDQQIPQGNVEFVRVAVDPSGELYISAETNAGGALFSFTPGQSSAQLIDQMPNGFCGTVSVDAAGNLFAGGMMRENTTVQGTGNKTTTIVANHWVVHERVAGQSTFKTVDDFLANNASSTIRAIICVGSGPSEAIYEVGVGTAGATHTYVDDEHWIVRKSADAGATWTTIDDTYYGTGTASAYGSDASGATVDSKGNLYVAGAVRVRTVTGGTARKPVYTVSSYLVVKKTSDGGASWTTDALIPSNAVTTIMGVGTDAAGNVYVADTDASASGYHGVVRSNAGGAWNVVDDFQLAQGHDTSLYAFARDPAGNLYVAGTAKDSANASHGFVRSQPAAPTNLTASPDTVLPSSQINLSWTTAGSDETGFAVYRSTDGVNFTLLGTVDASITSYSDGGLDAGTKYYYYVLTLLNSDGMSAPSGTASSTTSV